jgi:uncharacterized protein
MSTTLFQESIRQHGFFVPLAEVRIQGSELPSDVLRDVIQITYKDNVKEIDSFEMTVNNWDAYTQRFKYIGSETQESLNSGTTEGIRQRLFEPCRKTVEVRMGYMGDMRLMLTGTITTMEPSFPAGGMPTLSVRGMNVLNQLRRKQYTTIWQPDIKDSEIVQRLNALQDPELGGRRFPLEIVINPEAMNIEPVLDYVGQFNQYDIDFLLSRARQRGYVIYIMEPASSGGRQRLYFGPPDAEHRSDARAVTFKLEWQKSLIEFRPTLTVANQIRSVTVKGWNRRTREEISETVNIDDPALRSNRDLQEVLAECAPREEVVVEQPVYTRQQARNYALALLRSRLYQRVKATGTTVGLPDLRAGVHVEIDGIGSRLSGRYFVTETTHSYDDGGYTTRFTAERDNREAAAS